MSSPDSRLPAGVAGAASTRGVPAQDAVAGRHRRDHQRCRVCVLPPVGGRRPRDDHPAFRQAHHLERRQRHRAGHRDSRRADPRGGFECRRAQAEGRAHAGGRPQGPDCHPRSRREPLPSDRLWHAHLSAGCVEGQEPGRNRRPHRRQGEAEPARCVDHELAHLERDEAGRKAQSDPRRSRRRVAEQSGVSQPRAPRRRQQRRAQGRRHRSQHARSAGRHD